MSNRIIDYKWFYDLAADIDTLVDKVNKDLGEDIYYTFWNAPDGVVRIRDSRSEDVFYDWYLYSWWDARAWKDSFRKRFDRIIELLKGKYFLKTEYRKTENNGSSMDKEKEPSNELEVTVPRWITTVGYVDLDWSVASVASKGLYSRWATPVWKKVKKQIDRVIFNDPATIILWKSGEKTVVKCGPNEQFDKEKGLAMALCKYILGNKGNFNEFFKYFMKEVEE